jgi:nucleolar protein 56
VSPDTPAGFLAKCQIWARMILVTKWFGCFLCAEQEVKKAVLFPDETEALAERMAVIRNGGILEEERRLLPSADQVADRRLAKHGRYVKFDSSFIHAEDHGFKLESYRLAAIALAKKVVRSSIGPDVYLGQGLRAYDDLVFAGNMMSERLHEWYSLHFPELENMVFGEAYATAVADQGSREKVMAALELEMDSIGSDIAEEDLASVRVLASSLKDNLEARAKLERYVDSRMRVVAPNVASLIGPVLGARLLTIAGSLGRLASLPSGTVQLLGAEKAMFRHLKKKGKPPKHGVIYQHPLVRGSPPWQRGAIARAMAGKISIAARVDAYSRDDIAGTLRAQLDARVAEIRRQRPSPPKRPPKAPPGRARGRKRRPQ